MYIQVRPGFHNYLQEMDKHYEVVIFTACLPRYGDLILDQLDPAKVISQRLYREHCSLKESVFVKDLSMLGRRMEDVILLDNSPNSYIWQPQNALPISSWYGDYQDTEFAKLSGLFVKLSQVGDVREILSISHKEH